MKTNQQVVVITGAARGIGRATALQFATHDTKLVVVDIDREGLQTLKAEIESSGGEVLVCEGDLQDLAFARSVIDDTEARWNRLDVLINNAAWRTVETMRTISVENWERTLRVCLTAPAFLSRWAAELMEKNQEGGTILNVSSVMAARAGGIGAAYIASKGAIESLTYELAALYGPREIRVVAVAPGNINTSLSSNFTDPEGNNISTMLIEHMNDSTPLQRAGNPEEIANVLYWLSTPGASFISGTTIPVDGGFLHNFNSYSVKRKQFPKQF